MSKTLKEYRMTGLHKAAIASAHRGTRHDSKTIAKISSSMSGKANHAGKKHSTASKDRIRHQMNIVKNSHTYINRIKGLLELI